MRKYILLLIFFISAHVGAVSCQYPIKNIMEDNSHRIAFPEYVEILKNKLDNKHNSAPITDSWFTVYRNQPYIIPKGIILSNLSSLYKANTVNQQMKVLGTNIETVVVYPILNLREGFVSGYLILGYSSEVQNNYIFYTGIELIGSYLSQALEGCSEDK